MMTLICKQCKRSFKPKSGSYGIFCSRKCSSDSRSQKTIKVCATCGSNFLARSPSAGVYCTKRCSGLSRAGERAGCWRGGKIEQRCEICGAKFLAQRHLVSAGYGRFCSSECRSIRKSQLSRKENNHNWKGGDKLLHKRLSEQRRRTALLQVRNDLTKEQWINILDRYNNTCPSCGISSDVSTLTMDHIVPLFSGGAHTENNIKPLCRSCNSIKQ